ncbi:MAG TPA: hypothetical protein VHB79_24155 [Polyangiaceae bacterium]|nr:hypothetical protein [Polyangiaceae bacterium]
MSEVQRNPSLEGAMTTAAEKGDDTGTAYVIARNIIRVFSVFAVVFLRSRLGERYLTAFHVVGSLALAGVFLVGAYVLGTNPFGTTSSGPSSAALMLFVLYVVVLSARYGGIAWRRWRDDFSVHSRSDGDQWPLYRWLKLPFPLVALVVEPLLILVVGFVLASVFDAGSVGLFFLFGAVGHVVEQQLIAQAMRDKLLDIADAKHEQREYEVMAARVANGERYTPSASNSPFLARLPSSLESQRRFATVFGITAPPATVQAVLKPAGGE